MTAEADRSHLGPGVLALDIGTSSARSVLFDSSGAALDAEPLLQRPLQWRVSADGAMEADAEALLGHTVAVIDAALRAIRAGRLEIAAVATTSFWHSLVGAGADGVAVTPVYGWGDSRARDAARRLRTALGGPELHRRTGCFTDASYPSSRLLWLRDVAPDIFRLAPSWLSFGEYLGLRFFGERRCSSSMASGSGLCDTWRIGWDDEVLDAVGIARAALSPISDLPFLGLRPPFEQRWPELADVPWFPALGDGACANLGSGAIGRGALGLTIGTTAALRALVSAGEPPIQPALWCYRLDASRYVVGRALSNGGNVPAVLEALLRLPVGDRDAALAAFAPDGHGLTVLPFLIGERGPAEPPGAGAAIVGLTAATTPLQLLRASLESVALRLAEVAASLEAALGVPRIVVASGGALRGSPAWRQIVADVLGRPVALATNPENSARGAALLALELLGLIPDACAVPAELGPPSEPNPRHYERYRAAAARQRALASVLAPPGAPPAAV